MARCVRCQSLMSIADVGVAPPRAGLLRLRTRSRLPLNRFATLFHDLDERMHVSTFGAIPAVVRETLLGGLIPGLGPYRRRRRGLAAGLLIGWLGLLSGMVAAIGTDWYPVVMSWTAGWHAMAFIVTLRLAAPATTRIAVVLLALGIFSALNYFVYGEIEDLAHRWYRVLPYATGKANPVFTPGDVLAYEAPGRHDGPFERGDIVVYELPAVDGVAGGRGLAVDRIVGLPGERIEAIDGSLRVDGLDQPTDAFPLAGVRFPFSITLTLGPGEYAVLPSTTPFAVHNIPPHVVQAAFAELSRVPEHAILGRVVWRFRPWLGLEAIE